MISQIKAFWKDLLDEDEFDEEDELSAEPVSEEI